LNATNHQRQRRGTTDDGAGEKDDDGQQHRRPSTTAAATLRLSNRVNRTARQGGLRIPSRGRRGGMVGIA
jgi:hypothetical protein